LFAIIDELKSKILNRFEQNISGKLKIIIDNYNKINDNLRKPIKTADDVELMENYVFELTSE